MASRRPPWLESWLARHQHPASRALHALGIPLTLAAVGLAAVQLQQWRWDLWWRPVGVLLVGYVLQWLGHRIEGNDMGEVILVKRLRGRPYLAVAPRYQSPPVEAGGAANNPKSNPDAPGQDPK